MIFQNLQKQTRLKELKKKGNKGSRLRSRSISDVTTQQKKNEVFKARM